MKNQIYLTQDNVRSRWIIKDCLCKIPQDSLWDGTPNVIGNWPKRSFGYPKINIHNKKGHFLLHLNIEDAKGDLFLHRKARSLSIPSLKANGELKDYLQQCSNAFVHINTNYFIIAPPSAKDVYLLDVVQPLFLLPFN